MQNNISHLYQMLFSHLVILYYLADKWFWRNTILPPILYILIRNEKKLSHY